MTETAQTLRSLANRLILDAVETERSANHDEQARREYHELAHLSLCADDLADYLEHGLSSRLI